MKIDSINVPRSPCKIFVFLCLASTEILVDVPNLRFHLSPSNLDLTCSVRTQRRKDMALLIVVILFANATNNDDDEDDNDHDNNSIQFNSIQFNGYLLTCRPNSMSTYYKTSKMTQINRKNSENTQKQNTKQIKQKAMSGRKQYKSCTRKRKI